MSEAMVATVSSALLEPDRSVRVILPESDGVQVMVVGLPASMAPPDGEVMGLLWATTVAARVAMAATMLEKRILLNCGVAQRD
jgi:hypothetical protein